MGTPCLPTGITQTPNRLGCVAVQQNSNRVTNHITIAKGLQQSSVDQSSNRLICAPVNQSPNRINAQISMAKDAYQIAKEQDPTIGTREEWLESLKGAPGVDGETSLYDPIKTTLIGDGVTTVFAIGGAPNITNAAAVTVAVDGADQEPGVDYTVAGGLLTLTSPLEDGAKAVVISISNIADTDGTSWAYLLNAWTSEPIFNMDIAGGEVYDYTYGATTYYRFIPDPYDSSEDAFYASFVNEVLSGLIVARSQPI